ncbi:MAG: peptidylprolyl isomerase [Oscillospiraceae bacterium]|nr:peptidylprolyl isomerase [Oscillospiraceae bacterium]
MSASDKKKLRKEQAAAQLSERQRQEQAEAKKLKRITVTFVAIMLVVALTAIGVLGVRAVNHSGIIDKNTIAATTGEHKLNSVQMNYYLNDCIRNWASGYGENLSVYAGMMGLDVNKPINEQITDEKTGKTWADQFLQDALNKAKSDYALYDKAMAEGFKLTEDQQEALDMSGEQLKLYAMYSGYSNVNAYLRAMYGYGSTTESFMEYNKIVTIAQAYYNQYNDGLKYDDAAIREQDSKNPNNYNAFNYVSYYVATSSYLTGGTTDDKGNKTYTEEEKNAAVKKAEDTAKALASSADVEALDKAIKALEINKDKTDAASTKNTSVMYSGIPSVLQSWLADKARVAGDITYIASESVSKDADGKETKTINGYYVVIFQSRDENLQALANVRHLLVKFTGGTTDSDGNTTYSDAEKEAAKTEAEKYLKEWEAGAKTEDSFIELVKKNSDDGTATEGGLIEDIHRDSNLVPTFKNWALDADRKAGDTEVIVSEYGYHVMYYVGDDDMNYRDYMISEELRAADLEKWHTGITDAATITAGNTKRLNLDAVLSYM